MKPKKIQIDYLLLPIFDNSHIQEFIYKISAGDAWKKGQLPKRKFIFGQTDKVIEEYICPNNLIKVHECKIVRRRK